MKLKSLFLLIAIITLVYSEQSTEKTRTINKRIEQMKHQIDNCLTQKGQCQRKLKQHQLEGNCYQQKLINQRNENRIRQLERKLQEGPNRDQQYKIKQLQRRLQQQTQKVRNEQQQKSFIRQKIDVLKLKGQEYGNIIKTLKQQAADKLKSHLNQMKNLKDTYQQKIRNSFDKKCQGVNNQLYRKQEQCQNQVKTFGEKIKNLEENARAKASQFTDKLISTKNQVVGRIKNYLTGKGPYTRQEEEQFSQFKNKASELENKIKQNYEQIDKIRKEKQQLNFQQRYCTARIRNYDTQIMELQKQAERKGKGYYISQIKRLLEERERASNTHRHTSTQTNEQLIRNFKQNLSDKQQQLRKQLQLNNKLQAQNKELSQKLKQAEAKLSRQSPKDQTQINKLRKQNAQMRKVIKEIYSLKDKL